ncbi:MAG: ABC transporter permease [Bacillota bacterium]
MSSLGIAWRGIGANKLRTFLAMLGVIIGVAAVITLVSIGEGTRLEVAGQIEALGSNLVTVIPSAGVRLTTNDAQSLIQRVPGVADVVPSVQRQLSVKWDTRTITTTVEGVGPGFPEVRNFPVASGRFITVQDVEHRRNVVVLGRQVVTDLFYDSDPLGLEIRINGQPFTVVGVMEKKGSTLGTDNDNRVFLPISTAQRLFGTRWIQVMYLRVERPELAASVAAWVGALYDRQFGRTGAVRVQSQDQLLSTVSNVTGTMNMMLGGIAGVSLLVGGIGIMNIMLVSVTERTREIGIRKAVGAKRMDISMQFLVESVYISGTGGILGIVAGTGGSQLLARMSALNTAISPGSVVIAFAFAALVGLFFGSYPAIKAANLDPITALRYD